MPFSVSLPGIDFAAGLRHCGSDASLYIRLLGRFSSDPSFSSLNDALAAGDISSAFLHAHTLKGLSAQLGLSPLCTQAEAICELLRAQKHSSLEDARRALPALRRAYAQTLRSIARIDAQFI